MAYCYDLINESEFEVLVEYTNSAITPDILVISVGSKSYIEVCSDTEPVVLTPNSSVAIVPNDECSNGICNPYVSTATTGCTDVFLGGCITGYCYNHYDAWFNGLPVITPSYQQLIPRNSNLWNVTSGPQQPGLIIPPFSYPNFTLSCQDFLCGFPGLDSTTPRTGASYPAGTYLPNGFFDFFQIQFEGYINLIGGQSYQFRLCSDDGSEFTIYSIGSTFGTNNGITAPTGGSVLLQIGDVNQYNCLGGCGDPIRYGTITVPTTGWYPFTLDYYQGPRYQMQLQLQWDVNGTWVDVPESAFQHPGCQTITPTPTPTLTPTLTPTSTGPAPTPTPIDYNCIPKSLGGCITGYTYNHYDLGQFPALFQRNSVAWNLTYGPQIPGIIYGPFLYSNFDISCQYFCSFPGLPDTFVRSGPSFNSLLFLNGFYDYYQIQFEGFIYLTSGTYQFRVCAIDDVLFKIYDLTAVFGTNGGTTDPTGGALLFQIGGVSQTINGQNDCTLGCTNLNNTGTFVCNTTGWYPFTLDNYRGYARTFSLLLTLEWNTPLMAPGTWQIIPESAFQHPDCQITTTTTQPTTPTPTPTPTLTPTIQVTSTTTTVPCLCHNFSWVSNGTTPRQSIRYVNCDGIIVTQKLDGVGGPIGCVQDIISFIGITLNMDGCCCDCYRVTNFLVTPQRVTFKNCITGAISTVNIPGKGILRICSSIPPTGASLNVISLGPCNFNSTNNSYSCETTTTTCNCYKYMYEVTTTTTTCNCNCIDLIISQNDLDILSGNTGNLSQFNNTVIFSYIDCDNVTQKIYLTVDGNYPCYVCGLGVQNLTFATFSGYRDDLPYTQNFDSQFDISNCCECICYGAYNSSDTQPALYVPCNNISQPTNPSATISINGGDTEYLCSLIAPVSANGSGAIISQPYGLCTNGNCPTITTTIYVPTTTTTIPCNCYRADITILQSDLDAATGNTPTFFYDNNTVYHQYEDCNGNNQIIAYTQAGIYPNAACVNRNAGNFLRYYVDDGQTGRPAQGLNNRYSDCCSVQNLSNNVTYQIMETSMNSCLVSHLGCNGVTNTYTILPNTWNYSCGALPPTSNDCALTVIYVGNCGSANCLVTTTTTQPATTTTTQPATTTTTTVPCLCYNYIWSLTGLSNRPSVTYIDCGGNLVKSKLTNSGGLIPCIRQIVSFTGITVTKEDCCCNCYDLTNFSTTSDLITFKNCITGASSRFILGPRGTRRICSSEVPKHSSRTNVVSLGACSFNSSNNSYTCETTQPTTTTTIQPTTTTTIQPTTTTTIQPTTTTTIQPTTTTTIQPTTTTTTVCNCYELTFTANTGGCLKIGVDCSTGSNNYIQVNAGQTVYVCSTVEPYNHPMFGCSNEVTITLVGPCINNQCPQTTTTTTQPTTTTTINNTCFCNTFSYTAATTGTTFEMLHCTELPFPIQVTLNGQGTIPCIHSLTSLDPQFGCEIIECCCDCYSITGNSNGDQILYLDCVGGNHFDPINNGDILNICASQTPAIPFNATIVNAGDCIYNPNIYNYECVGTTTTISPINLCQNLKTVYLIADPNQYDDGIIYLKYSPCGSKDTIIPIFVSGATEINECIDISNLTESLYATRNGVKYFNASLGVLIFGENCNTTCNITSPKTFQAASQCITFDNVSLNGTNSNNLILNSGETISVSFDWSINYCEGDCPTCIVQHYIGLGGSSNQIFCYSQPPGIFSNDSVNATVTIPNTPGLYYLTYEFTLNYYCLPEVSFTTDYTSAIACVEVLEPIITSTTTSNV